MTPVLAACGVTCAYVGRPVLEGFDLVVEPGLVTVLVGPNGAGKTTALRALARSIEPRRGRVTLDGRDIWELPQRRFVRRVAFVAQADPAAGAMTVGQVVLLGRVPHRGWIAPYTREDRAAAAAALRRVGLEAFGERRLETLSGGELRRAMLARALVQEARVLLLDEPGAHLDLRYQVELYELLRQLARERSVAVLVSLHDLNLAVLFGDRAALLDRGRLVATGRPEEVLVPERVRQAFGVEVRPLSDPANGVSLLYPARVGRAVESREDRDAG